VVGVQGDLAVDRLGAQAVRAAEGGVEDRHAGLVAGGFDAEDTHAGIRKSLPTAGLHPPDGRRYHTRLARFDWAGPPTRSRMPSVKVRENEPFEFALRRFK